MRQLLDEETAADCDLRVLEEALTELFLLAVLFFVIVLFLLAVVFLAAVPFLLALAFLLAPAFLLAVVLLLADCADGAQVTSGSAKAQDTAILIKLFNMLIPRPSSWPQQFIKAAIFALMAGSVRQYATSVFIRGTENRA